jgi:hypothetical protein
MNRCTCPVSRVIIPIDLFASGINYAKVEVSIPITSDLDPNSCVTEPKIDSRRTVSVNPIGA